MSLQFYIDTPERFSLDSRYLRMRGWAYFHGRQLTGVRLALPKMKLFGRYGSFRPDVPKVYPEAPGDHTGFELRVTVPAGKHQAILEFEVDHGQWLEAVALNLIVPFRRFPLWLPGSSARDLLNFQLSARPAYFPRKIAGEQFPRARTPRESQPRLTVVTPSFNQCRYLGETISSVLEQDAAVDYVVQDGGSTDGSKVLIERFASEQRAKSLELGDRKPGAASPPPSSPRLVSWTSEHDHGQADAIARGFAKTSGGPDDLMSWINSDDRYLPGALAFAADYFSRHPEVDAIYGHRILIDENSQEIGRWLLPPHTAEMLCLNDYVPQETLFWRRRIWDKTGGIDSSFKFAMDWDLLLRFQAAGATIIRVPYFLACFRVHAAQKTSAQMESIGMKEIDHLRQRTFGRILSPDELASNPLLIRFLRKSAWIEFLWQLGIRAR